MNHPLFARLYGAVAAAADSRGQAEHRAEALAGLEGRVVEVGAGVGNNFRHYPEAVAEVVAVEPEPLVLCSVPDPPAALAELRRVIRPGGELRFYEHVVSPSARLARAQRLADRTFWPFVGGGCHCSRDTLSAIEQTGWQVETCRRLEFMPARFVGTLTKPHMLGRARCP